MGARRRGREHALKVLYQIDMASTAEADALEAQWSLEPEDDGAVRRFAERLVAAVTRDQARIDGWITDASRNWRLERIGSVDRNILRLALAELSSEPDTPAAVVIDEAVELAREYGSTESSAFVHGILEAARRRLRGEAPRP